MAPRVTIAAMRRELELANEHLGHSQAALEIQRADALQQLTQLREQLRTKDQTVETLKAALQQIAEARWPFSTAKIKTAREVLDAIQGKASDVSDQSSAH